MKDNSIMKKIGQNIQSVRIKKGYTQEKLAEKCDVSVQHIGLIERGKTFGSIPLIIDICNVLDITPNFIFGNLIKNKNDTIDILPSETAITYLKLKDENKSFVNQTIEHLYTMQNKR